MTRLRRKSREIGRACYSTPVESSVKMKDERAEWLAAARKVMEIEAQAILAAAQRLGTNLAAAVELILNHPGKLVVTGIGKSGHVARKLVATFQSTGTPAFFLHPAEAAHGDLGICQPGDTVLMISKSGATAELIELVPQLREYRAGFIGILGNTASIVAAEM